MNSEIKNGFLQRQLTELMQSIIYEKKSSNQTLQEISSIRKIDISLVNTAFVRNANRSATRPKF